MKTCLNDINSKSIELFKNLSQFDLEGFCYDFHNDYNCTKVTLNNNCLELQFKKIVGENLVSFIFQNVIFQKFELRDFSEFDFLTIDNLYRGRYEEDGRLIEFNKEGKAYFYVDFYVGLKIELWCENILLKK